jgi:hypothetical protein
VTSAVRNGMPVSSANARRNENTSQTSPYGRKAAV